MRKRIISVLVCVSVLVSLALPATAVDTVADSVQTYYLSETSWLEFSHNETTQHVRSGDSDEFTIKQFYNNALLQEVHGYTGGEYLTVIDYQNGEVVNTELIRVADRITPVETDNTVAQSTTTANSVGSVIGYITFNPMHYETTSRRICVFSNMDYHDNESYTIHASVSDTIATLAGLMVSALATILSDGQNICIQVITSIVSSLGGSVAGGAIGVKFSEPVSVDAYHYTLTGYDYSTGRYTEGYTGVARHVNTTRSKYYNEWFYDAYTPQAWKSSNLLHSYFWSNLWPLDYFPGVKNFS